MEVGKEHRVEHVEVQGVPRVAGPARPECEVKRNKWGVWRCRVCHGMWGLHSRDVKQLLYLRGHPGVQKHYRAT